MLCDIYLPHLKIVTKLWKYILVNIL